MKNLWAVFVFISLFCYTQNTKDRKGSFLSKFDISIHFGAAANWFVDYGRPMVIEDGNIVPPFDEAFGEFELYQKRMIGTIAGIELNYNFKKSSLFIAFEREQHIGQFNGNISLDNGTPVFIDDFRLRHLNQFFGFGYKQYWGKHKRFSTALGLYYLKINQSEVAINVQQNFIALRERNVNNANLEEGGVSLGFEYWFFNSGNFSLGLQNKYYMTLSSMEFETISLAPKLKYNF